jgi:hypothetical protein
MPASTDIANSATYNDVYAFAGIGPERQKERAF